MEAWPCPLLIDEIDKSDLDFANDLLNVIEEGEFEIPELRRLGQPTAKIRDYFGRIVTVHEGRIHCGQLAFVLITSNAEREFPIITPSRPPFEMATLRREVHHNLAGRTLA